MSAGADNNREPFQSVAGSDEQGGVELAVVGENRASDISDLALFLRCFRASDSSEVRNVEGLFISELGTGWSGLGNPPDSDETPLFVVAGPEGLVGMAQLRKWSRSMAEVRALYVHSRFRGLGVGRALLDQLQISAQGHGARWLRSAVALGQNGADSLHRHAGFLEIAAVGYWRQRSSTLKHLEVAPARVDDLGMGRG